MTIEEITHTDGVKNIIRTLDTFFEGNKVKNSFELETEGCSAGFSRKYIVFVLDMIIIWRISLLILIQGCNEKAVFQCAID